MTHCQAGQLDHGPYFTRLLLRGPCSMGFRDGLSDLESLHAQQPCAEVAHSILSYLITYPRLGYLRRGGWQVSDMPYPEGTLLQPLQTK